jgi:divalent metal cation (Fe/Co/Zn/Cd) transporter
MFAAVLTLDHLTLVAGRASDSQSLSQWTYFAAHFDPRILQVETVRGYHAGMKQIVEIDVILSPDLPLCEAHDVGEALQQGIETLAGVARCFVHLDYEGEHKGEHKPL